MIQDIEKGLELPSEKTMPISQHLVSHFSFHCNVDSRIFINISSTISRIHPEYNDP